MVVLVTSVCFALVFFQVMVLFGCRWFQIVVHESVCLFSTTCLWNSLILVLVSVDQHGGKTKEMERNVRTRKHK